MLSAVLFELIVMKNERKRISRMLNRILGTFLLKKKRYKTFKVSTSI